MKKTSFQFLTLAAILVLSTSISSCKKDSIEDPNPTPVDEPTPAATYDNGVFITCEGAFVGGTGTLSFYNRGTGATSNDIFKTVNGVVLGNLVQSMEIYNGKGYIVVNNADKIEVVNSSTIASDGKISGLSSPRYFIGIDANKGYVSQWGASGANKGVRVINLATKSLGALIPTTASPEKMAKAGNFVYVASSGFENDSVITIINSSTDAVVKTLTVGINPNSVTLDKNGKIWVLCGGKSDSLGVVAAKLVRINTSTNTVEASFTFPNTSDRPQNLTCNKAKDYLYYLGTYSGEINSFSITASSVISSSIINRGFYSFAIDPTDDIIYASSPGNFVGNGYILRYNSVATFIDSFQVGIIPGGFCFK